MDKDISTEDYIKYRKENFTIKVETDEDFLTKQKMITLLVSTNGYQFMGIRFTKEEWIEIKRQVNLVLKNGA